MDSSNPNLIIKPLESISDINTKMLLNLICSKRKYKRIKRLLQTRIQMKILRKMVLVIKFLVMLAR